MPSQSGGRNFFFRAFRTGWNTLTWRIVLFFATLCHLASLFTFAIGAWGLFCLFTFFGGPLAGFPSSETFQKATQTNLHWHGTDLAVFNEFLKAEETSLSFPFEILEKIELFLGTSNSQLFLLEATLASLVFAIGSLVLIHAVGRNLAESIARKAGSLFFLKLKISPGFALKHSENLQEQLEHIAQGGHALLCFNQPSGFIFVFSTLFALFYFPVETLFFSGLMGFVVIIYNFLWRFFWTRTKQKPLETKSAAGHLQGGAPVASFAGPNWIWNNEVKNYLITFASSVPYLPDGFKYLWGFLLAWVINAFLFISTSPYNFFVLQEYFFFSILITLLAVSASIWMLSLKHIENGASAANVLLQLNEAIQSGASQDELGLAPESCKQIQLDQFSLQHSDGNYLIGQTSLIFKPNQIYAISGLPKDISSFFSLALAGKFPYLGEIRFDNVNLRRVPTRDLSPLIGLIPHDGGILPGSIMENLSGGYFDHYPSKILTATRDLRLHKVISSLSESYDTKINPDSLSPLNTFLLGLCRAIIQEKKIMIMEPPNAQLTPSEEKLLLNGLKHVINNRFVLVFTNAPYLLRAANRIAVFQNGSLEIEGTPEEIFQTVKADQLYFAPTPFNTN